MRKAMRAFLVLLTAYLLQTTVLPHLKIGGVMVDLGTIALFAAGYYLGTYGAVISGLLMGLWMETLTGELGGLIAIVCLATSSIGAYTAHRFGGLDRAGKRNMDRLVRWFVPAIIASLIIVGRESIYLVYFYLTGVEIRPIHFFRVALAGLIVGGAAVPLLPLIGGFMLRTRENAYLARRIERWKNRKKPSPIALTAPVAEIAEVREPTVFDPGGDEAENGDPPDHSAYRRPEPRQGIESAYEFSGSYQRLPPKGETEGPAGDDDDWGF